ncbi:MAG: hypothetical protein SVR94_05275 [Pseudomonadota bacterium]|nr:hypothetical protein [Pseudomonadota bacterium]
MHRSEIKKVYDVITYTPYAGYRAHDRHSHRHSHAGAWERDKKQVYWTAFRPPYLAWLLINQSKNMTNVIFVHGTGVREESYEQSFAQIQEELVKRQSGLSVLPCYWGQLGAQLNAEGASIPEYNTTRSISDQAMTDEDYLISLWGVLYRDPLYEFRLLSLRMGELTEVPLGQRPPGEQLKKSVNKLPRVSEMRGDWSKLQNKLIQGGIDSVFDEACQEIINAPPFRQAINIAPQELDEYRLATARAIVAQAIYAREEERGLPIIATDARLRDEVVELLSTTLGNSNRGIIIKGYLFLNACVVTPYAKRKRGALTDEYGAFVGDILLYQTKGEEIRAFIHKTIQATQEPVILLAHSLGGIMSVDFLIKENLPQVKLLITAGSQSPYFYEINVLQSLPFKKMPTDERLPPHFPAWLNVYDHRDFLSYIGAGLFGSKVTDFEVNNRQLFPYSHSSYWSNSAMWDEIIKRIQTI